MIEQEAEKILKQVQNDRGGESGRTMTEMLAVIGIIGVLSVGGMTLGGYVIGGIKANRVVSGLQERILLAQKRRIIGQSTTFRDRRIQEDILGLYPVTYQKGVTDDTIPIYYGKKITVSEIPQQVCEGLKKDASLQATLDEVGGIISFNDGGEDGACKEENNEFFVLFGGRSEGKCHGRNNGCMACDEYKGEWVVDEAKDGTQVQDICHQCSNGNIVAKEKGKVIPCNGNECCTMFETCDAKEGCVTRCPANSSYNNFSGDQIGDSDCYCNAGYRVDAFQTGCRSEKICNPTCEAPLVCDDGDCVCPNEGDVYAPHFDTGGEMICCPAENIVDGYCCDNPKGDGTCCASDGTACCPPETPLYLKNGTCVVCDDYTIKLEVYQKQKGGPCSRCLNRAYLNAGYSYIGWCIPNECPEETPLMSYEGICYECGSKVATRDSTGGAGSNETCGKCPDENAIFDDKFCLPCPADMIVENGRCTCENGFMPGYSIQSGQVGAWTNSDPTCYSCDNDNLNAIAFFRRHSSNPCASCPNRIVVDPKTYYYLYCALETCPDGYMHNRYGHCLSCSGTSNIEFQPSSLTNSCSECGGLRYTDGNYCKKCPTDKSTLTETQCAECLGSWDGTVCH